MSKSVIVDFFTKQCLWTFLLAAMLNFCLFENAAAKNCGDFNPNCGSCTETQCTSYLYCDLEFSYCMSCTMTECTGCMDGYDLVNGHCEPGCSMRFGSSCMSCNETACTACDSEYTIQNGNCVPIASLDSNCLSLNGPYCSQCKNGYLPGPGGCVSCSDFYDDGCANCNSSACTSCKNGYTMQGSSCVQNQSGNNGAENAAEENASRYQRLYFSF